MEPYSAVGGTSGSPHDDEHDGVTDDAAFGVSRQTPAPAPPPGRAPAGGAEELLAPAFPAHAERAVPVADAMFSDPETDDDIWTGSWAKPLYPSSAEQALPRRPARRLALPVRPSRSGPAADPGLPESEDDFEAQRGIPTTPRAAGRPAAAASAAGVDALPTTRTVRRAPARGEDAPYDATGFDLPRPAGPATPAEPRRPDPASARADRQVPHFGPRGLPAPVSSDTAATGVIPVVPPSATHRPAQPPAPVPHPGRGPDTGPVWNPAQADDDTALHPPVRPQPDRWAGLRPSGPPLSEAAGLARPGGGLWAPRVPVDPAASSRWVGGDDGDALNPFGGGVSPGAAARALPPAPPPPAPPPVVPPPAAPPQQAPPWEPPPQLWTPQQPGGAPVEAPAGDDALLRPYDPAGAQPWRAEDGYPPDWPYRTPANRSGTPAPPSGPQHPAGPTGRAAGDGGPGGIPPYDTPTQAAGLPGTPAYGTHPARTRPGAGAGAAPDTGRRPADGRWDGLTRERSTPPPAARREAFDTGSLGLDGASGQRPDPFPAWDAARPPSGDLPAVPPAGAGRRYPTGPQPGAPLRTGEPDPGGRADRGRPADPRHTGGPYTGPQPVPPYRNDPRHTGPQFGGPGAAAERALPPGAGFPPSADPLSAPGRAPSFSGTPGASDPDTFSDLSAPVPLPRNDLGPVGEPRLATSPRRMTADPATGLHLPGSQPSRPRREPPPALPPSTADRRTPGTGSAAPRPDRTSGAWAAERRRAAPYPAPPQAAPGRPAGAAGNPPPAPDQRRAAPAGGPRSQPTSGAADGGLPQPGARSTRRDGAAGPLPGLPESTGWEWNSLYRPEPGREGSATGTQPVAGTAIRIDWSSGSGEQPAAADAETSIGAAYRADTPPPWDDSTWAPRDRQPAREREPRERSRRETGQHAAERRDWDDSGDWEELEDPFSADDGDGAANRNRRKVLTAAAVAVVVVAGGVAVSAKAGLFGHGPSAAVTAASVGGSNAAGGTPTAAAPAGPVVTAGDGTVSNELGSAFPLVGLGGTDAPTAAALATYAVKVEIGLPVSADAFAAQLSAVLNDAHGWKGTSRGGFVQVNAASEVVPDFTVYLVDSSQLPTGCAVIGGTTPPAGAGACFGSSNRVMIGVQAWLGQAPPGLNLVGGTYQDYLVNYALGMNYHVVARGTDSCAATSADEPGSLLTPNPFGRACTVTVFPSKSEIAELKAKLED